LDPDVPYHTHTTEENFVVMTAQAVENGKAFRCQPFLNAIRKLDNYIRE
jgi:hypothetical protein